MGKPIFTRSVAAQIIQLFEDVLAENNIHVPSPEDDEREPDDMIGLYGSTYFDLLDGVEYIISDTLQHYKALIDAKVTPALITDDLGDPLQQ